MNQEEVDSILEDLPLEERAEMREYLHMDPARQRVLTHRLARKTSVELEAWVSHVDSRFDKQDEQMEKILKRLDEGSGFWRSATYPVAMLGTGIAAFFSRDVRLP